MLDPATSAAPGSPPTRRRSPAAHGLVVAPDEGLLDEVAGLVEWPVRAGGAIDAAVHGRAAGGADHLDADAPAILRDDGRRPASWPPASSWSPTHRRATAAQPIVAGNERVLRARLSRRQVLLGPGPQGEARGALPALEGVVFHAQLGTRAEKVDRIVTLAAELPRMIPGADPDQAQQAAPRSRKADLVTGMVGEFPELQGIMGRYYALGEGWRLPVADAIARALRAARPERPLPDRAGQRRRGAGRQARHAGRVLRDRREADRLARTPTRCAARHWASSA